MPDDTSTLIELLQGETWVNKNALFNRSSFSDSDEFSAWLRRLVNGGKAQIRRGSFGMEVALAGAPPPDDSRKDARGPSAPPGAGPMPPALTAPEPPLEAPVRINSKSAEEEARPRAMPAPHEPEHPPAETGLAEATPAAPAAAPASIETREETSQPITAAAPPPSAPVTEPAAPPAPKEEPTMPTSKAQAAKATKAAAKADPTAVVLGLLRQSPWGAADLAKATGLKPAALKSLLKKLRDDKLVRLEGKARSARWHIAGDGKPGAIAAVDQVRKAAKKSPPPNTITEALEQLEQRMQPRVIERLEVKLEVLDRLGRLFDPTIAAVLGEIRADLAQ